LIPLELDCRHGVPVDNIVRSYVSGLPKCKSPYEVKTKASLAAEELAGHFEECSPSGSWNTHDGIGLSARKWMGVDSKQEVAEIIRTIFLMLADKLYDIARSGEEEWLQENRACLVIELAIHTLSGTAEARWQLGPGELLGWPEL
jgi:hypothetical protein